MNFPRAGNLALTSSSSSGIQRRTEFCSSCCSETVLCVFLASGVLDVFSVPAFGLCPLVPGQ